MALRSYWIGQDGKQEGQGIKVAGGLEGDGSTKGVPCTGGVGFNETYLNSMQHVLRKFSKVKKGFSIEVFHIVILTLKNQELYEGDLNFEVIEVFQVQEAYLNINHEHKPTRKKRAGRTDRWGI